MRRQPSGHPLLLAAALLVACKQGQRSDPSEAPGTSAHVDAAVAQAAVPVEAAVLVADYRGDALRGDQRWKGKLVEVSGSVNFVHKGMVGEPAHVMLSTGAIFELPQIKCYLRAGQTEAATNLSRGQKVTMRGRVNGLRTNVQIDDCEIVGVPAQPAGIPRQ